MNPNVLKNLALQHNLSPSVINQINAIWLSDNHGALWSIINDREKNFVDMTLCSTERFDEEWEKEYIRDCIKTMILYVKKQGDLKIQEKYNYNIIKEHIQTNSQERGEFIKTDEATQELLQKDPTEFKKIFNF